MSDTRLAVGLDPTTISEMIAGHPLDHEPESTGDRSRRIQAPVNEVVLTGDDIDLTKFPAAEILAGRRRSLHRHRRHHVHCRRPILAASMSAATGRCCRARTASGSTARPASTDGLDRDAWWARGEPCEVVAAYGIDPVLFMLAAQSFGTNESELDVAGGIMGRPIELTQAEYVSLPIPANAEFVIEGVLHQGDVTAGRTARRVHRLLWPRAFAAAGDGDQGGASSQVADLYPCADGAVSILRDRRLLRDHALRAHSRRPRTHRRAGRGRGLFASGRGVRLGHGRGVDAAEICRPLGTGPGAAAQCPAAAYYTKWIIVVDEDVDPTDFNEVLWALSTRCHPSETSTSCATPGRPASIRASSRRGATLRLEGADQCLQAAPAPEAVSGKRRCCGEPPMSAWPTAGRNLGSPAPAKAQFIPP